MFTTFTRALPLALIGRGNNFQLEIRLKFFSVALISNLCNSIWPIDPEIRKGESVNLCYEQNSVYSPLLELSVQHAPWKK